MTAPVLAAEAITAGYHGNPAIRDISLEVRPGEVVALLGGNGAGKTTTISALAGLLPVISGAVLLHGHSAGRGVRRRVRDGVGLVTERRCIFSRLTCRENLRLGRGSVDSALAFFPELVPHLDVEAGLLSGGQQQMIALGRVLAGKPRVILADELSLGLAPLLVRRILRGLTTAAADGAGVLIVEQHPRLALEVADRGYVIRRGEVVLVGTAADLRANMDGVRSAYL